VSPFQVELGEFIRRLGVSEDRERTLRGRVVGLYQGVRELQMWKGALGAGSSPILVTITGKVIGCATGGVAMADSTIHIVGHQTGTDYGTWPVPTGTYTISYYRDPGDSSLDIVATHASARFGTGPVTNTSASGALANVPLAPAAGYSCCPPLCNYPLANTLSVQDGRIGNDTITHGAGGASAIGVGFSASCWTSGVGANPIHALDDGAARWGGKLGASTTGTVNFPGAATCPDLGGTKFDITYTWGSNTGPYLIGDTVRFFEP
jgi:hypothetical protein